MRKGRSTYYFQKVEIHAPKEFNPPIFALLRKHEHVWPEQKGHIHATTHRIDLAPGARLFKFVPYRAGPKAYNLGALEIKRRLPDGVMEHSNPEWVAQVLFAPKKEGRLRCCVDYWQLNAMNIKDSYPLPRTDECTECIVEARIFSTLDAFNGYWQINVAEQDIQKKTFVCHYRTFQYIRTPLGFDNRTQYVPTCFVSNTDTIKMENISSIHGWHYYLFKWCRWTHPPRGWDYHHAWRGLRHTQPQNCRFFSDSVDSVGQIIKHGRLEMDQTRTKCFKDATPPTKWSGLRSFLGLCKEYRLFIPDFTGIEHPINKLLRKCGPENFELDKEQQKGSHTFIGKISIPASYRFTAPEPSLLSLMLPPMASAAQFFKTTQTELTNPSVIGHDHYNTRNATILHQNESASTSLGHLKRSERI